MDIRAILDDPAIRSIHRLPASAFSWPSSRESLSPTAWLYDIDDWSLSLNGTWSISWSPDVPENCTPDCAIGASGVQIPASLELLGFGTPIYLNYGYPFDPAGPGAFHGPPPLRGVARSAGGCPPRPSPATTSREPNPSAVLSRTFRVPVSWSGRLVRIRFLSVQSAFFLWCNGAFVGYSEDSALPADFDLTPHLAPLGEENRLTVLVCKYCSGSYLEDQDCWRLSGIPRDVFLFSVPETHLADAVVQPDFPAHGFRLSATIASPLPGCTVEFTVDGTTAIARPDADASATAFVPLLRTGAPPPWSPETPTLLPVRILLRSPSGAVLDIRHFRTALVDSRVQSGVYLLNGRPFKFQGANRHEIHPVRGRAITREDMLEDARLLKAAHFNAVRCSHYPNHPLWYEICDRVGLALCDEANVESHGLSYHACVLPGDLPVWGDAVVERVARMVRTDRNHPSILLWSLGNEAGYGDAFLRAREALRALDPRPVQYADMNTAADFDSQTYPTSQWLRDWLAGRAKRTGEHGERAEARQHGPQPSGRPYLANEYAHAMGNSSGDLDEWWSIVRSSPRLAGGFVWEWCEHALCPVPVCPVPGAQASDAPPRSVPGRSRPGLYGGDFGDVPNNGPFCCDGLVRADRTPNPGYYQLRHLQQPLAATLDRRRHAIRLENRRFFLPIAGGLSWVLLRDGAPIASGDFPLPSPIAPGGHTLLPLPHPVSPHDRSEYFWRIRLHEGGTLVAECELSHFPRSDFNDSALPAKNPWWSGGAPYMARSSSARPLAAGVPLFDRSPTDNDLGAHYASTPADPARIGLRLSVPRASLARVAWYGRGPFECACDRKSAAFVGLYEAAPDSLCTPYTHPQENGQRCDIRYLDLIAPDGSRRRISSPRLFSFTLRPYTHEALCAARHDADIVPDPDAYELILDAAQRGVGGDNSWGLPVLPRYTLAGIDLTPEFFEYVP